MIRIFVGCAAGGEDAESQAVLEYTLRRHATAPLAITWMKLSRSRKSVWSGWNTAAWSTPFTGLRWAIPEVCGFEGRAIYMDSDIICRADISELWRTPFAPGQMALLRETTGKLRTCVMLLDCAAARGHVRPLVELKAAADPHRLMVHHLREHRELLGAFEGQWNCIDLKRADGIDDPTIRMIHYSSMPHQPHLKHARKRLAAKGLRHWYDGETAPHWRPELEALFDQLLREARAAGYWPELYEPDVPFGDYRKKSFSGRRVKERA